MLDIEYWRYAAMRLSAPTPKQRLTKIKRGTGTWKLGPRTGIKYDIELERTDSYVFLRICRFECQRNLGCGPRNVQPSHSQLNYYGL